MCGMARFCFCSYVTRLSVCIIDINALVSLLLCCIVCVYKNGVRPCMVKIPFGQIQWQSRSREKKIPPKMDRLVLNPCFLVVGNEGDITVAFQAIGSVCKGNDCSVETESAKHSFPRGKEHAPPHTHARGESCLRVMPVFKSLTKDQPSPIHTAGTCPCAISAATTASMRMGRE